MSEHEPGDPNNYPVAVALVDDGTLPTAANVNLGLQDLADRTECIRAQGLMTLMMTEFLEDGTWPIPADLASPIIEAEFCGGGGGGGGRSSVTNGTDRYNSGGAGGGAALLRRIPIDVSDFEAGFEVGIGVGPGGGGGAANASGADGGYSYLDFPAGIDTKTYFAHGGSGGGRGRESTDGDTPSMNLGGPPMAGLLVLDGIWSMPSGLTMLPQLQPGQGGHAATASHPTFTLPGASSPVIVTGDAGSGGNGGQKGTKGTDASTRRGGGGGGGGGGGPFGTGGDGGNGGDGNGSGAGASGANGANAAANSGAGGGGGGGPGYGSASVGGGGAGGNGGSGRVRIFWWKKGRTLP